MNRFAALILLLALALAALGTAAPVRAQTCGETYTVQKGDTLFSIASRCRVSYVVLTNINYEIGDPDLIRPGQVIRITAEVPLYVTPASGPGLDVGLQEDGRTFIVRRGDSLARIAYLYGTTVYELLLANPDLNGSTLIHPGQHILLPYDAVQKKGWVGVSALTAWYADEIEVRAADFTPYADLEFRLHQKISDEMSDYYDPDVYSVIAYASTDALGKARATLRVPYYAYNQEIWVVDVYVINEGADAEPVTSPDILIDR